jgi:NAD(P)-dependent dehydrogenase (short-subunit alcohol dehydrogenase family)
MSYEFDLTGRVAFVTGATRGLGRRIADAYAAAGASIAVVSRKADACAATAAEIEDEHGVRAVPIACNVSNWADCGQAVDAAYSEFGRVDILVNNAGMSPLYPSLVEVSEELFDKVLAVNFKGPFRLSALIGTRMQAGDGGSIINISSVSSVQPRGSEVVYGAAKAGLNALSQSLVRAFGPAVRVNTIMPGPFLTDIAKSWDMDSFQRFAERSIALKRAGEPEEIVGAALYLAGDASSFTSGAVIRIDGGYAWAAS